MRLFSHFELVVLFGRHLAEFALFFELPFGQRLFVVSLTLVDVTNF